VRRPGAPPPSSPSDRERLIGCSDSAHLHPSSAPPPVQDERRIRGAETGPLTDIRLRMA